MQLWSHAYLENEAEADAMTCTLTERDWVKVHADVPAKRLIADIQFGGQTVFCALGSPVRPSEGLCRRPVEEEDSAQDADTQDAHTANADAADADAADAHAADAHAPLFVPYWVLERLGANGMGETVTVEWRSEEAFPEATRIVLRPHDSAFYHGDAKAELEAALTRLGVLRTGDTVTIPLTVLGGFEIGFDVVATEPADVVLMQGDEVAIEFEAARDGAAEAQSVQLPQLPQPRPGTPSPFEGDDLFSPIAPAALGPAEAQPQPLHFPGAGQALGGTSRRMPDGRPWNPWRT